MWCLNHLSFLDFIYRSHEAFNIGENEIMGSLSPLVFDIYVLELCMLMYRSATIVLLPAHLSAFPVKILKIMQQQHVTFYLLGSNNNGKYCQYGTIGKKNHYRV